MTTSLSVRAVTKRFGKVTALEDVSMTVEAGSILAIVGPSGCGKSTMLRLIAGLEQTDTGTIHIGDRDITHVVAGKRNVGMVFQQPATFPYLTVADNLAFGMKVRGVSATDRRRRVGETAELLGITALLKRRPAQLSGGERQRVEIGRALLRDPDVMLFDEPLSSLDAHLRLELRNEIARIQREVGTTTVIVTHDQVEAMVLGAQVAVMRDGRVVQHAEPSEIYDAPADVFVARFVGSPPMNLFPAQVRGGKVAVGATVLLAPGCPDGPVTVGVRPADLVVASGGGIAADVIAVEDQGADLVLNATADGLGTVAVRVPRGEQPVPGTRTHLGIRVWHLFAPTGERLATATAGDRAP